MFQLEELGLGIVTDIFIWYAYKLFENVGVFHTSVSSKCSDSSYM